MHHKKLAYNLIIINNYNSKNLQLITSHYLEGKGLSALYLDTAIQSIIFLVHTLCLNQERIEILLILVNVV